MKPTLVHLTTADISLELLLGPQLSAFADAGYHVIAMSSSGPFVDAIAKRGIEHVAVDNATRSMSLGKDIAALGELYKTFRSIRPDIVHTHNPKPGVYGRIAARAARVPCVVNTVHGLYAQPTDSRSRRGVVYSLERIASTCSDAELVQNIEDMDTLRNIGVASKKIVHLGNGIDLERFNPTSSNGARTVLRDELSIPHQGIVVGAVGRLVAEKGYHELFDAWKRIARDHENAYLLVVGPAEPDKADGISQSELDEMLSHNVRFAGMREDVEELYHAMDLYVLASHREGFPRSAMEAAACGLPVIATDIRGCRQVVDDSSNGLLVSVNNTDALAGAIDKLIGEPSTRRKMSENAVTRARERFDQQRVIDITLRTYERLGQFPR